MRVERYWRPRPRRARAPTRSGSSGSGRRSTAAVRRRLVADVPLGALLSGGLDSSIVVAAMAAASAEPVRTFTIGFPDRRYDERPHARPLAERYGTDHTELEVDPGPSCSSGSPRRSTSRSATRRRCRCCSSARRRGATSRWRSSATEATSRSAATSATGRTRSPARLPRPAAALGAPRSRPLPAARRQPRSTLFRARRFLDVAAAAGRRPLRPAGRGLPARAAPPPVDGRGSRPGDRDAAAARPRPPARRHRVLPPGRPAAEERHRLDGVSLELRSPLLDHRVVELGLALPPALAAGKAALRRAFAADLPPETLARSKTGFGVPLDRWFRDQLRSSAEELLLGGEDRGPVPPRRARAAAPRAHRAPGRPRPPPLVSVHARAVAAPVPRR